MTEVNMKLRTIEGVHEYYAKKSVEWYAQVGELRAERDRLQERVTLLEDARGLIQHQHATERDQLRAEIERLRSGIKALIEDKDAESYRIIDQVRTELCGVWVCIHGRSAHEGCTGCVNDYLQRLLGETK